MISPNAPSENRPSLWDSEEEADGRHGALMPPDRGPVDRDLLADVCIIGAGIAGLSTAYLLAREGISVVVVDDGPIGGGQTSRTTAHLTYALDDRFYWLEKIRGTDATRMAYESHRRAITQIEEICERESIDCDFRRVPGYLFVPPGDSIEVLEHELETLTRIGMTDVEFVDRAPWADFNTGPCLRFPDCGRFQPLEYLHGLANAIERMAGLIHLGTHVKKITGGPFARIETSDGHTIAAGKVVVATNTPINDLFAIHTKQAPYASYAIAGIVPRGSVTDALYWDTLSAYHYVRLHQHSDEYDMLIVGGEDHKVGQANDQAERFARLEEWTRERFPNFIEVTHTWSGIVQETVDGLAFIGRNPMDYENVFIATGDSGMGMTHGTIAGILITDQIQGRANDWTGLYAPDRRPQWTQGWKEYVTENANVALQYARDWLGRGEVSAKEKIEPGKGAVIRRGVSDFVAVHVTPSGETMECSAVCPHLGCIVHWNDAEKTWDCPCHGSRFSSSGDVIVGPAVSGLKPVAQPVSH